MPFPTKPTVANGRIIHASQANTTATRTFPNFDALTFNAGDRLIAIVVAYQTSTGTDAAFSGWGGGMTERADRATSTTMAIGIAEKIATGSETGTFTVTQAGTITGHAVMFLMAVPGAHPTTPIEVSTKVNGTSANATPSALAPSWGAEDNLWAELIGVGETGTGGSFTGISGASTNYTDLFGQGTLTADAIGGVEPGIAFRALNAASEQPAADFSVDTSNARHSVVTIAIRPAPAATEIASVPGVAVALGIPQLVEVGLTVFSRQGQAVAFAVAPEVSLGTPPVQIASIPGIGVGLSSPPDVSAILNIHSLPGVAMGISALSTVAAEVTVAPNPAFGIVAASPPDVSTALVTSVDAHPGVAIGLASPPDVTIEANISIASRPGLGVGLAPAPDVTTAAVVGIDTTPGLGLGASPAPAVSAQAIVGIASVEGVAVGLAPAPTLTISTPVSVTTPPAVGVGLGMPVDVALALVTNIDPPPAVSVGFAAPSTVVVLASVAVLTPAGVVIAIGSQVVVSASAGTSIVTPPALFVGVALPVGIATTEVDLITPPAAIGIGIGGRPALAILPLFTGDLHVDVGHLGTRWRPASLRRRWRTDRLHKT